MKTLQPIMVLALLAGAVAPIRAAETDAVPYKAAPRPLAVAGRLERYGYDFAARTLEVSLKPGADLGGTVIFVPADRFYPDGFRVEVGLGLVLALKPGDAQLRTVKFADETSREQARLVHWDADSQHIVIKRWIDVAPGLTVKIAPMTEPATLPTRP